MQVQAAGSAPRARTRWRARDPRGSAARGPAGRRCRARSSAASPGRHVVQHDLDARLRARARATSAGAKSYGKLVFDRSGSPPCARRQSARGNRISMKSVETLAASLGIVASIAPRNGTRRTLVGLADRALRRQLRHRHRRGGGGHRRRRAVRADRRQLLPVSSRLRARRGPGLRARRHARCRAAAAAQRPREPAAGDAARAGRVRSPRSPARWSGLALPTEVVQTALGGHGASRSRCVVWRTGDAAAGTGEADALGAILRLRGRYERSRRRRRGRLAHAPHAGRLRRLRRNRLPRRRFRPGRRLRQRAGAESR